MYHHTVTLSSNRSIEQIKDKDSITPLNLASIFEYYFREKTVSVIRARSEVSLDVLP